MFFNPSARVFVQKRTAIAGLLLAALNCSLAEFPLPATATAQGKPFTPLADGFKSLTEFSSAKAILSFSKTLLNSKLDLNDPAARQSLSNSYALIARAFSFDENDEAAISAYSIAAQLDPKNYVAKAFLADILARIGRNAEAAKLFQELDSAPDDINALKVVKAGRIGRQLDFKKQEDFLKQCISNTSEKDQAILYSVLARTYLKEGFNDDASAAFFKASKGIDSPYVSKIFEALSAQCKQDNKVASDLYRDAGKILPNDPSWMTGLGGSLERLGKKDEGLDWRMKAIHCLRNSSFALSQCAFALNAMKRSKDATLCLDRIAEIRPTWAEIFFLRGLLYMSDKDFKNAQESFKQNLKRNNLSGITYVELGKSYEASGQVKLAEQAYSDGGKLFPTFPQYWSGLGFLQLTARNWQAALPLLQRARNCYAPQDWPRMNILFLSHLARIEAGMGICYYNLKQPDKAAEMAKAYNQHKFDPELKGLLGMMRLRPRRLDFTDKAMLSANTHMALADMLMEFRDLDGAIKEAKLAVAEAPNNVEFHSFLLYALTENNQWVDAAQEDMSLSNQLVNQLPKQINDSVKKIHF